MFDVADVNVAAIQHEAWMVHVLLGDVGLPPACCLVHKGRAAFLGYGLPQYCTRSSRCAVPEVSSTVGSQKWRVRPRAFWPVVQKLDPPDSESPILVILHLLRKQTCAVCAKRVGCGLGTSVADAEATSTCGGFVGEGRHIRSFIKVLNDGCGVPCMFMLCGSIKMTPK